LPTSRSTARGSKRTACCGCLRLRRPPSSLSDFGWPGCKSACAVHFSADSWPIEPTIGLQIVEKLSSRSRLSPRPPKPDRLLARPLAAMFWHRVATAGHNHLSAPPLRRRVVPASR
jgi:hypothetical protein